MSAKANIIAAVQACADASGDLDIKRALGDPTGANFKLRGETVSPGVAYTIPGFFDCMLQGIGVASRLAVTSVKTGNYTAHDGELVLYNPSGGTFILKAPSSPAANDFFGIKNNTNSVVSITLDGNGKDLDGSSSIALAAASICQIWHYNGAQWNKIGQAT